MVDRIARIDWNVVILGVAMYVILIGGLFAADQAAYEVSAKIAKVVDASAK